MTLAGAGDQPAAGSLCLMDYPPSRGPADLWRLVSSRVMGKHHIATGSCAQVTASNIDRIMYIEWDAPVGCYKCDGA